MIQVPSTIYPAVASNSGELLANPDGSYDLYFGPEAPEGKEPNWVETIPGKSCPRSCVSTARSSPGLTRPGNSTNSNPSTDQRDIRPGRTQFGVTGRPRWATSVTECGPAGIGPRHTSGEAGPAWW
jgi:uncharacterized protein DUF1214